MEKLSQPGEGGGCTPTPFTKSTIKYKVEVYAPAERADTLLLFLLYSYMYSVDMISRLRNGAYGIGVNFSRLEE